MIKDIELFVLKCAVIEGTLRTVIAAHGDSSPQRAIDIERDLNSYIRQFTLENRRNAITMAEYYKIFYMLENDIRKLIVETMEAAHGVDWWNTHVPIGVKDEAIKNRQREEKAALSARSEDQIDYTTFGQLWDIIRENWPDFAGMLSNESAVGRVLSGLNMLRGTIAHCGVLAEDEVDRLKLAIRDWFRVLQGPKKS
jgi:hypothetical protein